MTNKYIKYTSSILDAINFATTDEVDFDNYLKNSTKSYLLGKQSFLEEGSGTSDVAYMQSEIAQAYLYLSNLLLPKYKEIKVLEEIKRTTNTTFNKGEESITNIYFEPVENGTQNAVENNGAITSSDEDTTVVTESVKGESQKLVEFYDLTKDNIERVFIDFINIMV